MLASSLRDAPSGTAHPSSRTELSRTSLKAVLSTEARFTYTLLTELFCAIIPPSNKKVLVSTVPNVLVALEIGWRGIILGCYEAR